MDELGGVVHVGRGRIGFSSAGILRRTSARERRRTDVLYAVANTKAPPSIGNSTSRAKLQHSVLRGFPKLSHPDEQ